MALEPAPHAGHERAGRLARWTSPWRDFGALDGTLYLMHRALGRLTRGHLRIVPYGLYAQPIGAGAYVGVRDDPRTQVVDIQADAALLSAFPRPAAVIAQRFADRATCRAALVKGEFGGFIWLSHDAHDEDEVRVRYALPSQPRSVWDFDVYVEPSLRLGRTLARLWKAVDAQLAAEGVAWSFSRISRFNGASVSTHARLGARRVGSATFFVIGPCQVMLASMAPFMHVGFTASQRPRLHLAAPVADQPPVRAPATSESAQ